MKILIADTLDFYSNYIIPADDNDCNNLLMSLIGGTTGPNAYENSFTPHVNLAKFIFDDVEHYSPEFIPEGKDIELCKTLRETKYKGIDTLPLDKKKLNAELKRIGVDKSEVKGLERVIAKISPSKKSLDECWIISPDHTFTRRQLQSISKFNKQSIISIFATCGVDFILPSIYIKEDEELYKFKDKFQEERLDYLLFLDEKADDLLNIIGNDEVNSDEIIKYAKSTISVELELRAKRIESAFATEGKKALKYMCNDFKGKIPSIGTNLLSGNIVEVANLVMQSIKVTNLMQT